MLVSNYELKNFIDATAALQDKKIDFNSAIKIIKLRRAALAIFSKVEKERWMLMDECLERNETGDFKIDSDGMAVKPDKVEYFQKALEKLQNDQQIPDIYFSEEEIKGIDLTLQQIEGFFPFIK